MTAVKETHRPLKSTAGRWCSYYSLPKEVELPYTFIMMNKEGDKYLVRILKVRSDGIELGYNKLISDEAKR